MLRIAVIEKDQVCRKKITDQLSATNNLQIVLSVTGVNSFRRKFLSNEISSIPDLVLLGTLSGPMTLDKVTAMIKEFCPKATLVNYIIIDQGETLILRTGGDKVLSGDGFFAFKLIEIFASVLNKEKFHLKSNNSTGKSKDEKIFRSLTSRQLELAEGLSIGLSYAEMAEKLCISINTIRAHVKRIYEKLEVNNKVELANKYSNCLNVT